MPIDIHNSHHYTATVNTSKDTTTSHSHKAIKPDDILEAVSRRSFEGVDFLLELESIDYTELNEMLSSDELNTAIADIDYTIATPLGQALANIAEANEPHFTDAENYPGGVNMNHAIENLEEFLEESLLKDDLDMVPAIVSRKKRQRLEKDNSAEQERPSKQAKMVTRASFKRDYTSTGNADCVPQQEVNVMPLGDCQPSVTGEPAKGKKTQDIILPTMCISRLESPYTRVTLRKSKRIVRKI